MAPIERSAVADATPSAIWAACFEHMKWESWDEDIVAVEDINGGCTNDATCSFVMNEKSGDMKVHVLLSDVRESESLTFSGSRGFLGMMKFKGTIDLHSLDEGKTKVDYCFQLFGWAGPLLNFISSKEIVGGTESGLANIATMGEAAVKSD